MTRQFEIHQGEWTYVLQDDAIDEFATANVAQCTVFCGRTQNGFAFMLHIDIPFKCRLKTLGTLEKTIRSSVPAGSEIEYHIAGGWKCAWSPKVRDHISEFMKGLGDYEVMEHSGDFTDEGESFFKNQWKKGMSFNLETGDIDSFPIKKQTKRKSSLSAWVPFCEMPLVRPESDT